MSELFALTAVLANAGISVVSGARERPKGTEPEGGEQQGRDGHIVTQQDWNSEETDMSLVAPFHTFEHEDGDKLVYHNQSECEHGQEIIRNGHKVDGDAGRTLCEGCADLAGG